MEKPISRWNLACALVIAVSWYQLGVAAAVDFEGVDRLIGLGCLGLAIGAFLLFLDPD